jgi:hypothetical protein
MRRGRHGINHDRRFHSLLRLAGLWAPALARHRRVRGVTLTRLPDFVRCDFLSQSTRHLVLKIESLRILRRDSQNILQSDRAFNSKSIQASSSGRAVRPRRSAIHAPLRSGQNIHALAFADMLLTQALAWHRRVRGVTLTRLPDLGRGRPSIRCDFRVAIYARMPATPPTPPWRPLFLARQRRAAFRGVCLGSRGE